MKIVTFKILPYEQDLVVVYEAKSAKAVVTRLRSIVADNFKRYIDNELEEHIHNKIQDTSNANFIYKNNQRIAIIMLKDNSHASLVHEVCHFTFWLFDIIGLPLKQETDEAYTYMIANTYKRIVAELDI